VGPEYFQVGKCLEYVPIRSNLLTLNQLGNNGLLIVICKIWAIFCDYLTPNICSICVKILRGIFSEIFLEMWNIPILFHFSLVQWYTTQKMYQNITHYKTYPLGISWYFTYIREIMIGNCLKLSNLQPVIIIFPSWLIVGIIDLIGLFQAFSDLENNNPLCQCPPKRELFNTPYYPQNTRSKREGCLRVKAKVQGSTDQPIYHNLWWKR